MLLPRVLFILSILTRWVDTKPTYPWPMVGWEAYRSYDMARFRDGEVTRQFSSYDRTGNNDDGGDGRYSCLRIDAEGWCVIAEADGPGQVSSIWFTYEPDSVAEIGDIRIELDSKMVLEGDLQSIVRSEFGSPFIWPLVGDSNDTSGGSVIKAPMPYRNTMLITTEYNPHYYTVVYRTFPSWVNVTTFDPGEDVTDIVSTFMHFGVRDPKPIQSSPVPMNKSLRLSPGQSGDITLATNCGTITQLQIRIPEILGSPTVIDDGRAFGDGGGSSMTFQLDPSNTQCKLTRRVDASVGHTLVNVSVDEEFAGTFTTGEASNGNFLDQILDLDSNLTRHKSSIRVSTNFVSSDFDANEFAYALHCKPLTSWDNTAYGPSKDWTLMDILNVGPNNPHDEAAHEYTLVNETWNGLRNFSYTGDRWDYGPRSTQLLNDITLSMTFDDEDTVSNVPLGSFFGTALAKQSTRQLLFGVDDMQQNGPFMSWFPLPAANSAKLTVKNGSPNSISPVVDWSIVECLPSSSWDAGGRGKDWGHFSIQHRRGETVNGEVWPMLSETGPGVGYGVSHTARGSIFPPANDLEFFEGNIQVYINRTTPPANPLNDTSVTMLGTGTEDFYESGWNFIDGNTNTVGVPFDMPLTGLAGHLRQQNSLGCIGQCLDAHRLMLSDSVPFPRDGISFNIQHGPVDNDIACNYETSFYYYK